MTEETKNLLRSIFGVVVSITALVNIVCAVVAATAGVYDKATYFMASAVYLNTLD